MDEWRRFSAGFGFGNCELGRGHANPDSDGHTDTNADRHTDACSNSNTDANRHVHQPHFSSQRSFDYQGHLGFGQILRHLHKSLV